MLLLRHTHYTNMTADLMTDHKLFQNVGLTQFIHLIYHRYLMSHVLKPNGVLNLWAIITSSSLS